MRETIKLVFIYFGYQLLFSALMTGCTFITPISYTLQIGLSLLLSGAAMTFHLLHFKHINLSQSLRAVPILPLLYCIGCVCCFMLCSNALNELLGLPNLLEEHFISLSRSVSGALSIALMAPIVEELLFRGAIMGHLQRQGYSPRKTIVVSALVFGLIHINPAQVVFAFLMGLLLGWIAWRTRSLIPVIAGHALNNTIGVVEMAFSDSATLNQDTPPATLWALVIIGSAATLGMAWLLNKSLPKENPHEEATNGQ